VSPGLATWDSSQDAWELYDLRKDFSQAENLADREPERLAAMKAEFLKVAEENQAFPIGAGIWLRIHPEDRIKTPYTQWVFDATTTRMPEFTAPGLGRESTHVTIDAELPENASGVLYALGGASGGLTLYMDRGRLVYEYNMMIIERYGVASAEKIPAGRHRIEVETTIAKPGAPAEVLLRVDGAEVARTEVARTVPAAFTASETFDVRTDLGSPGVAGLLRPAAIPVRRADRLGDSATQLGEHARPETRGEASLGQSGPPRGHSWYQDWIHPA
jgi:arylsulfatase